MITNTTISHDFFIPVVLPLTIPANYRLSSQFLSVGLKVGVRVWLMQKYLFATVW
jgi:hypothetical protein